MRQTPGKAAFSRVVRTSVGIILTPSLLLVLNILAD
jgi:hypothetical protein